MPGRRFTDERVAFALRRADGGTPVGEICRKMGVSEATFCRWRKIDAGMGVAEIGRLKQLEDENGKLERLVAGLSLDEEMLRRMPCERSGGARPSPRRHPARSDGASMATVRPRPSLPLRGRRGGGEGALGALRWTSASGGAVGRLFATCAGE